MTKGHLWQGVLAWLCQAGSGFVNFSAPLLITILFDNVLNDYPIEDHPTVMWFVNLFGGVEGWQNNIWLVAAAHLTTALLIAFFVFGRQRLVSMFSENTAKRMKDRLYDHIQKLPYNYHVSAQTGDLIQRCTSDVEQTRRFLSQQTVEIARAIFFTTAAFITMRSLNMTLTLISFAFLPIIFIFSYIFFRAVRRVFKQQDEKEGELSTVLQESITGVRVVRAFGRARFEVDKFIDKNDDFKKLQFKQMKFLAWFWSLSDILCFAQIVTTFVMGIYFVSIDTLTVGGLVAFNTAAWMMVWPIRQLGRVMSDLGRTQVAMERIYEVLDEPAECDTPGATPHDLRGDIVFNNVDFAYGDERKIFDGMSFTVKKGETISILGATGSGKSTLMLLMLRLYDYNSGSITINGKELRDISKEHLRKSIGIVLQEPFLYSRTIRSNLEMAKEGVAEDEIFDATRTASAHNFITEFEEGYETMVGERGVTLSGGQKQRVAIARTLIKDSEMLIFDDSLSAVDTETDAQIREALATRKKDITTFIISQRITTLMNADRIFVVEDGKIADIGTHGELISRDGLYKRIWDIQSMLEAEM